MEQNKINRINFLAKKKKSEGLSESELAEQKLLRDEYIAEFRASVRADLENTVIKYPDGHTEKVSDRKKK